MVNMITTLSGENTFLLKSELERITHAYTAENGDLGLERLDGEEDSPARINEALTGIGLLADKKMVVIRGLSKNKEIGASIAQLIGQIPETTDVVFVEHKIDKRSSVYKTLKTKTDYKEFNKLDGKGLGRWLTQRAKAGGGKISLSDAEYLVERVGQSQLLLSNELDKLLTYEPNVTRTSIDLLTEPTPQSTVFQLLESAFGGNLRQTMRLYDEQREQKVEPQEIVAMLAWQLNILAIILAAGQKPTDQIAKEAKIHPYTLGKSRMIARKLTLPRLKELINELLRIDLSSKSRSINLDEAVQKYLIELSA